MKYNFENKTWVNEVEGKTYAGTFMVTPKMEMFWVVNKKGEIKEEFKTREEANEYLTERRKAWGWKIVHRVKETRIIHDWEMEGCNDTPWTKYNLGWENR